MNTGLTIVVVVFAGLLAYHAWVVAPAQGDPRRRKLDPLSAAAEAGAALYVRYLAGQAWGA